ncbi:type VI secretion system membrane subunit TssM [Paraburkholderia tropica]|uniref:Type VI secretion system protein ImpL n=1 Tax=Paraburkholderia tropica TaxID=92647 RepID=A0AAQ1JUB1_9BURK|nr:type VI secretion system membrane subunit TssM [Paraburkholderia tropica]RQN39313.1 type VI secretion system membrane subunit TssM [Paraburkholderia tropica]SEJ70095.1 type VI secretion system protein ImpL [Paraburkholderia tropica]
MKKLSSFLSFLTSRWFLAFFVLILVAVGIWSFGPYVAFGGLKPLATVGMRVLIIALLFAAVLLWLLGWSAGIVLGALLCLLIWHAAPLLTFGQIEPFASVASRITAIVVVVALFAIWGLYRLWQRMRRDDDFLRKALAFGQKKEESPAAGRIREVENVAGSVMVRLKAMRTGARGVGRLFQGTRYLYEVPWYIALGATASGKTSALLNAGLHFPVGAPAPRPGGSPGHTRQVDWWLTNDAVLIDTAGYYTLHGTSTQSLPAQVALARTQSGSEKDGDKLGEKTDIAKTITDFGEDAAQRVLIDEDEWQGFLSLLRRQRPRAPINGALLAVSAGLLSDPDASVRSAEAAALRARLTDLRAVLGIRFPVYLLITQMDRVPGFAEYFSSLTEESRGQMWGFTLPLGGTTAHGDLVAKSRQEFEQLSARLAGGVNTRLEDDYDPERRRSLAALAESFAALGAPLDDLLTELFADSRYDDTQLRATLRGVYFTSATQQHGETLTPEPLTIIERLRRGLARPLADREDTAQGGSGIIANHSYFLHDLFARVVIPEAHLVRPNLRWEYRFRFLRLLGHVLALLLFVWLAFGLRMSFGHNTDYLDAIGRKTQALAAKVTSLYREPKPDAVPDTLAEARYLPTLTGLDLSDPDSAWRYGLYTPPGVVQASRDTYRALENNLLLPQIVHRLEDVMAASISGKDAKATYDALRVYLMLYDRQKFNAGDVKAWVLDDWARTDSASVFGGRASMISHLEQLFSGDEVVQSPLIRNDALIQQARALLDSSNATQRLYERAKADMLKEAPDEFTLLRAVGPQAGTIFTRASGAPLSRGVSGLFTFDGYRNLFDKRVREFASAARDDDAWVMGRSYLGEAQKKTAELAAGATGADDPVTEAIRRLYLTEYAQQWDAFLGDIRTVRGTSLAFNLQVLRQFAAPDSPLGRLARAAVRETTLTRAVVNIDPSILQKAAGKVVDKALGIRAEERIERELVDSHFAALRESVTGSADVQSDTAAAQGGSMAGKTGLDAITSLLNDYYTSLTVADNAIANNSLPPTNDAAAKLKMAAATMPAPFREVLLGLSIQGSREVNQGIGQLLSRQMQAVVNDTCRLTVEGNYPFAPDSKRDVSIDDFTRVFAQGGVLDDFFTKNLAPFVDTSARPWRYRTLPGATEPVQGPDLEPFQHAKAIREVFFGDQGKQLAWKADVRVPELDPTILGLSIDIDGQSMLYQHGPLQPFSINWPGPRGGVHAEITANPRIRMETSTVSVDGPWALMRLMQRGHVIQTATPGRTRVAFDFDGRKAVLDIASAGSLANPLTSDLLTTFRCPSSMPMLSLPDSGPPVGLPPAGAVPMPAAGTVSG